MKRWIIILSAIFIIVGGVVLNMSVSSRVDMNFATDGVAVFKYGNNNISTAISQDDFIMICDLFEDKKLYSDNPSCGFSDDVSVIINETEQFLFACDSCPIVYWKNKNQYFRVSEIEYDKLTEVLEKYGFVFPCL